MNFGTTIDGLFRWTIETSIAATILLLCVLCVQRCCDRLLRPSARYALSCLVIVRLLLPVVPSFRWSVLNLIPDTSMKSAHASPHDSPLLAGNISSSVSSKESLLFKTVPSSSQKRIHLEYIWFGGAVLFLVQALRRHRKFTRDLRGEAREVDDPDLQSLLEECKSAMGVKSPVHLVRSQLLRTPAVFGFAPPTLILPCDAPPWTREELRFIFLHELCHVRRKDVFLNWLMIGLRAWHWFNPILLFAFKRIRLDRELVCDASVLSRLQVEQRRPYGHTLLRLFEQIGQSRPNLSVVPIVNNNEIKRRLVMIKQFKPSGRLVALFSIAVVLALASFAIPAAVDQKGKSRFSDQYKRDQAEALERLKNEQAALAEERRAEINARRLKVLRNELDSQKDLLQHLEKEADTFVNELGIDVNIAEGKVSSTIDPEFIRQLEQKRSANRIKLFELEGQLAELGSKNSSEQPGLLASSHPDVLLPSLLETKTQLEQKAAELSSDKAADHPEVQQLNKRLKIVQEQIYSRTETIIAGMKSQRDALKDQTMRLADELERTKRQDAEKQAQFRPYFALKREIETRQKVMDRLYAQMLDEEVESHLPARLQR